MIKKYKKTFLICAIIFASVFFATSIFIFNEYKKFDPEVEFDDDLQNERVYKKLDDFISKYNKEDTSQDSEDEY